ncbi:MAG: hypothetical protein WCP55_03835 [Lentisphaerota bacterium]
MYPSIKESKPALEEDYFEAIRSFYEKSKLLPSFEAEHLIQMMTLSERAAGVPPAHIETSDSGNVFVRWAENDDSIWLLGVVSPKGKMGRADVIDLSAWVGRLAEKMMTGKPLHTSPNEVSGLLIKRLEWALNNGGYDMRETGSGMRMEIGDSPYLKWKMTSYVAEKR